MGKEQQVGLITEEMSLEQLLHEMFLHLGDTESTRNLAYELVNSFDMPPEEKVIAFNDVRDSLDLQPIPIPLTFNAQQTAYLKTVFTVISKLQPSMGEAPPHLLSGVLTDVISAHDEEV